MISSHLNGYKIDPHVAFCPVQLVQTLSVFARSARLFIDGADGSSTPRRGYKMSAGGFQHVSDTNLARGKAVLEVEEMACETQHQKHRPRVPDSCRLQELIASLSELPGSRGCHGEKRARTSACQHLRGGAPSANLRVLV